jgi:hypothetical protein
MDNGMAAHNPPALPAANAAIAMATVAGAVAQGRCILFLGAGIHYPPPLGSRYEATYPPSVRAPLGMRLAKILARHCYLKQSHPDEMNNLKNLARIAGFYEMNRDRAQLVATIQRLTGWNHRLTRCKRPSAALRALAQLDFPLVLTTNYDHLFEDALRDAGKRPRVAVYNPDRVPTIDCPDDARDPRQPFVFKVHGDVDFGNSVVITDDDYIHFTLRMGDREEIHPVPDTVRVSLKKRPTLFIGYSLLDYDLRLLFKTLRWKLDKTQLQRWAGYAVDFSPDPLIVEQFERRERCVQFIVQDLWAFVPELYWRVKHREMPT